MNLLVLSGFGCKISVQDLRRCSELVVTDGREDTKQSVTMRFKPRRFPYSSIAIDGHSGYISLRALHWLSSNKIPVFVTNFDGTLISSILPPMPVKADLRAAQFQAVNDQTTKFAIAHTLVKAKIMRSLEVLDWLAQRYDIERGVRVTKGEAVKLGNASTVSQLRTVEGRVALRYWEAIRKILPDWLDFQRTLSTTRANNASDPFNAALNYGYSILKAECRRSINAVGLEPSVGFLHDFANYQTKESLVYDLQEPFRWLIDVSVIQTFESKTLGPRDFYFTGDDYRYRFELDAKKRFIQVLREKFNIGVAYKGRKIKWGTVILEKTGELARYLSGRSSKLDFIEPVPILERFDSEELREQIKALTSEEAKKAGIDKSTLYTLRQHVRKEPPFKLYRKTLVKLQS